MTEESSEQEKIFELVVKLVKKYALIDVVAKFFNKPYDMVIVGPTGVGKSRVFSHLTNDHAALFKAAVSTMDNVPKKVKSAGKTVEFHDTPGQSKFGARRQKSYDKVISKDQGFGVILISSFGYHEQKLVLSPPDFENQASLEAWFKKNRNKESRFFLSTTEKLIRRENTQIVFTIVNKSDIIKEDWDTIVKFYSTRKYAKVLENMGIPHEILPYCSELKSFWGSKNYAPKIDVDEARLLRVDVAAMVSQFGKP